MLIVVAVFAMVALAMLAAVIDLGDTRQEGREVALSTDSAALAVAALIDQDTLPIGESDCSVVTTDGFDEEPTATTADAVASWYLENNGGTVLRSCGVSWDGYSGYVTVRGTEDVEYAVGSAFGVSGTSVGGVSTAVFGNVRNYEYSPGGGLRSIGVCLPAFEGATGLTLPDVGSGNFEGGTPIRVDTDKLKNESPCEITGPGGGGGQFGGLNYHGSPNSGGQNCDPPPTPEEDPDHDGNQCEYATYGYHGEVDEHEYGYTGDSFKSQSQAYDDLADAGTRFLVPVFDGGHKAGGTTTLHITHFLEASLTRFDNGDFEMIIYRSYPFSVSPPTTSDAGSVETLTPVKTRLCSFSNAPEGDECQVAHALPSEGGGGGGGGGGGAGGGAGGDATCVLDGPIVVSDATPSLHSNNKLKAQLSVKVPVVDVAQCDALGVQLRPASGTGFASAISHLDENPAVFTWGTSNPRFTAGTTYFVIVRDGTTDLDGTATVTPSKP